MQNLRRGYLCDTIVLKREKREVFKKLFLTSIIALCTLVPVYADDSFVTNESTCDNDTLGSTESANLVATWTPNPFTITYACGSPINGSASTTTGPTTTKTDVEMDGAYTLAAADNCSLTGYTFAGWACPNLPGTPTLPTDAQTKLYFAGSATGTYSYAGDVTCTAQWTQNKVNLTWYDDTVANNGQAITLPQGSQAGTCTYDSTITLPAEPSKTGYTFKGWKVRPTNP